MTKYTIKKGNHSASGLHFGVTFSNKIKYECMFDKSCLYDLKSGDNYDINKLFGFSTTWHHQKQSARVGWRCIDGQTIQIVTYTYNDGKFDGEKILGTVFPGEKFICSIEDKEDYYLYRFQKDIYSITQKDTKKPDKFLFNYLLYPYVGGNNSVIHNMTLFLKKL